MVFNLTAGNPIWLFLFFLYLNSFFHLFLRRSFIFLSDFLNILFLIYLNLFFLLAFNFDYVVLFQNWAIFAHEDFFRKKYFFVFVLVFFISIQTQNIVWILLLAFVEIWLYICELQRNRFSTYSYYIRVKVISANNYFWNVSAVVLWKLKLVVKIWTWVISICTQNMGICKNRSHIWRHRLVTLSWYFPWSAFWTHECVNLILIFQTYL